jgi:hypothetical protein
MISTSSLQPYRYNWAKLKSSYQLFSTNVALLARSEWTSGGEAGGGAVEGCEGQGLSSIKSWVFILLTFIYLHFGYAFLPTLYIF